MRRSSAAGLLLLAASSVACDPPDSVSAEEVRRVTCMHARAAFGFVRASGRFVAEPRELAGVLEVDARLLRAAGDEATAVVVERVAEKLHRSPRGPDLVVHLRDDVTDRQRNGLEERAVALPGVETVRFVPSEEAYERLDETEPEHAGSDAPDVLPDSYEIAAGEGADLAALRDRLKRRPGVDAVDLRGDAELVSSVRALDDVCDLPS